MLDDQLRRHGFMEDRSAGRFDGDRSSGQGFIGNCGRCGSYHEVSSPAATSIGISYEELGLDPNKQSDLGDCLAAGMLPICANCLALLNGLGSEKEKRVAFVRGMLDEQRRRRRATSYG
jgi:hypothetical protein